MKKLFALTLAAFAMVACVNEEITELPNGNEISFENAFIDNATRVGYAEADDLNEFNVWGYVESTDHVAVEIFGGTRVYKNNGVWKHDATKQYWFPERTYNFSALADADPRNVTVVENGTALESVVFVNDAAEAENYGTKDLLYATTTPFVATENQGAVEFTFSHLLSKVMFSFENSFDGVDVEIQNVTMTAPKKGTYTFADKKWTLDTTEADLTLSFGNVEKIENIAPVKSKATAQERLTIPADASKSYAINFQVVISMNGNTLYTKAMSSAVSGVEFEQGHAYKLSAAITPEVLNLTEITFDVEKVNEWSTEEIVNHHSTTGDTPNTPDTDYIELTQFWNSYIDFTTWERFIIRMATEGVSYYLDYTTWQNVYEGTGNFLSLDIYCIDGKIYTGTYTAAPIVDGALNPGEFGIGYYNYIEDWDYGENIGTLWYTVDNNNVTMDYVTDGTVEVAISGNNVVITLNSTAAKARYTCPKDEFTTLTGCKVLEPGSTEHYNITATDIEVNIDVLSNSSDITLSNEEYEIYIVLTGTDIVGNEFTFNDSFNEYASFRSKSTYDSIMRISSGELSIDTHTDGDYVIAGTLYSASGDSVEFYYKGSAEGLEYSATLIEFTFDGLNVESFNMISYTDIPGYSISIYDDTWTNCAFFDISDFENSDSEFTHLTTHHYPMMNNFSWNLPTSSGIAAMSTFTIEGETFYSYVPDSPTDEDGNPYGVTIETEMPYQDMNTLTFNIPAIDSDGNPCVLRGSYTGPLGYEL